MWGWGLPRAVDGGYILWSCRIPPSLAGDGRAQTPLPDCSQSERRVIGIQETAQCECAAAVAAHALTHRRDGEDNPLSAYKRPSFTTPHPHTEEDTPPYSEALTQQNGHRRRAV